MLTIPNAVSLVRLLLIPVFLWLLFGPENVAAAGWLVAVIGSTDWVDGYLARRLNQVSEVGKLLDPLADRAAVIAAVVGGWVAGVLPPVFSGLLLGRELLIGVGALVLLRSGAPRIDVRYLGKLATFMLYSAVAWFYWGNGYDANWLITLAWIVGIPGLIIYYWVLIPYIQDVRRSIAATEVSSPPSRGGDPA